MIIKPSAHLLAELEKQGVKEPEAGFLVDDQRYGMIWWQITAGHPSESVEQRQGRAQYQAIWEAYGVPANATERGAALINDKRLQELHQSHRELNNLHIPALQEALSAKHDDLAELLAKQHAALLDSLETENNKTHAMIQGLSTYHEHLFLGALRHATTVLKWAAYWALAVLLVLLALLGLSLKAHAQVDCIQMQQSGTVKGNTCAPVHFNFTGCTVTKSGITYTIACSAGSGSPGGISADIQYNNAGAFGGITPGALGTVLISQGAGVAPAFADPLVQGTQAAASASQPNPVMGGLWDGAALRAPLSDATGNQAINVAKLSGTAADTNSGSKSAGTLRVVLATDQPALTNKLLVTPDSVALPANQSVNVAQVNGVTTLMGNGTTGTGSQRVTVASDNTPFHVIHDSGSTTAVTQATGTNLHAVLDTTSTTAATQATGTNLHTVTDATSVTTATLAAETTKVIGTARILGNAGAAVDAATGAAPPANAVLAGGVTSGATGGFVAGIPISDSFAIVNISTATTTLAITGVSGRHVRIGAMNLITAAANNVAFIEGTGATCGTGTTGMAGGTTAASGYNFAANGGIAQGTGLGTIMRTTTTGDSVCLVTSASTQLSGHIAYTIY